MEFGSLTGKFWFGLNALHCLTSQGQWELRIDLKLTNINGTIIYLPYNKFAVGPATEQYPLTISGFIEYTTDPFYSDYTPNDSGAALNTIKFTTRDKDNDHWPGNYLNHISGGRAVASKSEVVRPARRRIRITFLSTKRGKILDFANFIFAN